jgi:GTP-binding protein LepA
MVGYIIAGIKTVSDTRIGDTITLEENPAPEPLAGFKDVKPVVFSSIYPIAADDYLSLKDALEKYKLNDAALVYQKDSSAALGQGFRCGFLGLLHLEIVQERLEREFDQSIILTVPSVQYRFTLKDGSTVVVDNPQYYPDPIDIAGSEEPYIRATIFIPERYVGPVMKLCMDRRGVNSRMSYPAPGRVELSYMPLASGLRLTTASEYYAGVRVVRHELTEYRESDLVKLDILVNGERADAFRSLSQGRGASAVRVRQPPKRYAPAVQDSDQGAIGQIISRSTISAFRKDVTAKCYGGDITREKTSREAEARQKEDAHHRLRGDTAERLRRAEGR